MADVLLVGSTRMLQEPGGEQLVAGLAARGVTARWVRWDDPEVDWSAARVVAVRATWDYHERLPEFLAWAKAVDASSHLLNGAEAFVWNTDKAYLMELVRAGVPVVPSQVVTDRDGLGRAAAAYRGRVVIKPCVSIGGIGLVVFDRAADVAAAAAGEADAAGLGDGPWLVQPVVESVSTEGETSVFVIGGQVTGQVRKLPAGREIRVHEQYGGRSIPVDVDAAAAELARTTVAAAERLLRGSLPYARVDLMRMPDGALVVGELEVTEPGLYLDVTPQHGEAFCDLVARLVAPA